MRRLRRVGVRQWPRARFRRAAIASAAVRPHGRGDPLRPRLQRHAPRLGGVMHAGCFARSPLGASRGPARQPPRRSTEPPSDAMWPNVPSAGRLPARHRDDRVAALDCALRRPRRHQPTTLPVAALWMAAPYHAVTRAARGKRLANSLPPLARRSLLPPVTTRFAPIRTPSPAG